MIHVDSKFLRLISSQLPHFKQKSEQLYTFRCPICGDSEKNSYKARGYVFRLKESLIFKCHNCGDSRSLGNLIKAVNPNLFPQYIMERFKDTHVKPPTKAAEPAAPIMDAPVFKKNTPTQMLIKVGAVKLGDLQSDHPAIEFLTMRKVPMERARASLYFIDDESALAGLSDKYESRIAGHSPRLILPFCNVAGEMLGLTGRALDTKGLRYLTMKFSEKPMFFGLENWDASRHTFVVEGPIDSLFLDNGLAVGGSDFGKLDGLFDRKTTTLIYDREPRNKEIVSKMEKSIEEGWSICIMPHTLEGKDLNDFVLEGYNVAGLIESNTYSGLAAKMHLAQWRKI